MPWPSEAWPATRPDRMCSATPSAGSSRSRLPSHDPSAWRSLSLLCTGPGALGDSPARPLSPLVQALGVMTPRGDPREPAARPDAAARHRRVPRHALHLQRRGVAQGHHPAPDRCARHHRRGRRAPGCRSGSVAAPTTTRGPTTYRPPWPSGSDTEVHVIAGRRPLPCGREPAGAGRRLATVPAPAQPGGTPDGRIHPRLHRRRPPRRRQATAPRPVRHRRELAGPHRRADPARSTSTPGP